jgi:hypothetical protein
VQDVQVGVADAGSTDLHQHLAGTRSRLLDLAQLGVALPTGDLQGTHGSPRQVGAALRGRWLVRDVGARVLLPSTVVVPTIMLDDDPSVLAAGC